jgi:hypothetical protein
VMVFTYLAARTRNGRVKGRRYPITFNGVKTQWKRIRPEPKLKASASMIFGTFEAAETDRKFEARAKGAQPRRH